MMTKHRRQSMPWSALGTTFVLVLALPLLATDSVARSTATSGPASAAASVVPLTAMATVPAPPPLRRGLAQAAVDAAQGRAAGSTELAVAVYDRYTRELAVGGRGHERYYTASLAKLVVIVDVLDRRRLEGLAVTDDDLALFARALGPSDDSAMSALWERFDGAGAIGRVRDRLGLEGTAAPRRTGQWGEVEVTAADYVRIWRYVLDEMPAADRELLLSDMAAAPDIARDGFDQAFGLLAPEVRGPEGPGAVAKQGWMCCFTGQYYLHSAGVVGADQRFVVALLNRVPRGPGWASARGAVTGIATVAVGALE